MDKNTEKTFENESHCKENAIPLECCFNELKKFFYLLALFSFAAAIFLSIVRGIIYSEQNQTGILLKDILFNRFIECGWKAFFTLPALILIYYYQKNFCSKHSVLTGIMFSIISFLHIVCGMLIPFIATATSSSYEIADLLFMFSSVFCMFFVGETAKIKLLKRCAYIFLVIPILLLGAISSIEIYYQYSNTTGLTPEMVSMISIFIVLKGLCYMLFPSICYLIIALQMKKCSFLKN